MISTRAGYELESTTYLQETETHRFEYDAERTPPSMAVVAAMSEATETEPMALGPLQRQIDADALDTLMWGKESSDGPVRVEFTFEGHTVTLDGDGLVEIGRSGADRTQEGSQR